MDVVSDSCILLESVIETNFQINIQMVTANIQINDVMSCKHI